MTDLMNFRFYTFFDRSILYLLWFKKYKASKSASLKYEKQQICKKFEKKSFWQEIQNFFRASKVPQLNSKCFADTKYNFSLKWLNWNKSYFNFNLNPFEGHDMACHAPLNELKLKFK